MKNPTLHAMAQVARNSIEARQKALAGNAALELVQNVYHAKTVFDAVFTPEKMIELLSELDQLQAVNYQPIGYVIQSEHKGGVFFANISTFDAMVERYKDKAQKVFVPMLDNDPRLCRWCNNASTNHSGQDHVFASRVNSDPQASKLMLRTKT